MKIPNRFQIVNDDNDIELRATSLRKAMKMARKVAKFYDTEARVVDTLTGVIHYIYREYVDDVVTPV